LTLTAEEQKAIEEADLSFFDTSLAPSDVDVVLEQLRDLAMARTPITRVSWSDRLVQVNGWWIAGITYEAGRLTEIEWHQADGESLAWVAVLRLGV
jgi:hypothetical protein